MATATKNFTAVGRGNNLFVRYGEHYTYSVGGTFVGTVYIEKSQDGGKSFHRVAGPFTAAASGTLISESSDQQHALYQFNCTAYTSGTIETELEDVADDVHVFENSAGEPVLVITDDGIEIPAGKKLEFTQAHDPGSDSYQPIAVDFEVTGTGSNDGTDPGFLAPVMGHLMGDAVSGDGVYGAGLIGAISAAGMSSAYPVGGVMGILMQGSAGADAPVVSVIDGDDGGAAVNCGAMFKARMNNNHASSGAQYGLDLYDAGNANYTGGPVALKITKADVRMSNEVCVMNGAGAPVDGTTGDDFAGKGSLYIDRTNGEHYINTGTKADPAFSKVKRAGESFKIMINAAGVAKVGATAGWAVAPADNLSLITCPASQTAATLVVPITGLKVGQRITAFHLVGQIESGGNTVTVDADLRKHTAAAADVADASIGSITQLSVTADTIMSASNTAKTLDSAETIAADETVYVLITVTTGASTDVALQAIAVTVSEA